MAKNITLRDSSTSEELYPETSVENVYDLAAWVKSSTKPSYTASEVGAVPTTGGTMSGALTAPQFKQTFFYVSPALSYTINPNIEYFLSSLIGNTSFTLGDPENNVVNEYKFQFDMGSTTYTISGLSASIVWQGDVPSFEANKHYEISIKAVPATWNSGSPATWRYFGLCSSFDLT